MVLKLKIKLCYKGTCIESIGIANTGFSSRSPEITLPDHLARGILGEGTSLTFVEKVLADGTRTVLARTSEQLDLYLIADDRVEGPVKVYAYIVKGRAILLSDSTLKALKVVIIDPLEGVWCFRDEIGKKERRGL